MKQIEFKREVFSCFDRIPKEVIADLSVEVLDDFLKSSVTRRVNAYFYSNTREERELVYYCDKPTFFDWLFGRKKRVVFNFKVKDLLINPPDPNVHTILTID